MVRAIIFGQKAISEEGFARMLRETGAEDGGTICFTLPVNCVESFPNGTLCRSHVDRKGRVFPNAAIDCGEDMERFLYVNSYGRREKPSYEDLVQMLQDGEMSIVDFVEAQEDLIGDYHEWLRSKGRDRSELSAGEFLDAEEDRITVQPPAQLITEDLVILLT